MKRYSLGVDWNSAGRPEPCAKEMSAGRFILFADHAVLLRAVADEARRLKHWESCAYAMHSIFRWREEPYPDCNCPRGKVLAMLEVEK